MRKLLATLLPIALMLNSCTSVKIKGETFYKNGESGLQELINYLDHGIKSNLTAKEIKEKIAIRPQQIAVNKKSENWFYRYSKTSGKIGLKLTKINNKEQEIGGCRKFQYSRMFTIFFGKVAIMCPVDSFSVLTPYTGRYLVGPVSIKPTTTTKINISK